VIHSKPRRFLLLKPPRNGSSSVRFLEVIGIRSRPRDPRHCDAETVEPMGTQGKLGSYLENQLNEDTGRRVLNYPKLFAVEPASAGVAIIQDNSRRGPFILSESGRSFKSSTRPNRKAVMEFWKRIRDWLPVPPRSVIGQQRTRSGQRCRHRNRLLQTLSSGPVGRVGDVAMKSFRALPGVLDWVRGATLAVLVRHALVDVQPAHRLRGFVSDEAQASRSILASREVLRCRFQP